MHCFVVVVVVVVIVVVAVVVVVLSFLFMDYISVLKMRKILKKRTISFKIGLVKTRRVALNSTISNPANYWP